MTVKSALEIYYNSTPSTIRALCELWKYPKHDIALFLHGAFMFLPWPKEYKEIQKELDFLAQINRIR